NKAQEEGPTPGWGSHGREGASDSKEPPQYPGLAPVGVKQPAIDDEQCATIHFAGERRRTGNHRNRFHQFGQSVSRGERVRSAARNCQNSKPFDLELARHLRNGRRPIEKSPPSLKRRGPNPGPVGRNDARSNFAPCSPKSRPL